MITAVPITTDDQSRTELVLSLFSRLFPTDLCYLPYIQQCVERATNSQVTDPKRYHVLALEVDNQFAGFRIFAFWHQWELGYSSYVGIDPAFQGRGLARPFQNAVMDCLRADAREAQVNLIGLCGEMARPMPDMEPEELARRVKRVETFRHLGARIADIDYFEPFPCNSDKSRPALLYCVPENPGWAGNVSEWEHIVQAVFNTGYNLGVEDALYRRAIESLLREGSVSYHQEG